MKLDILAIAVHPDDAELCCAGTSDDGKTKREKSGNCRPHQGRIGHRGNPELRAKESIKAAAIMGVDIRENLGMADGFFQNDGNHQQNAHWRYSKIQAQPGPCQCPSGLSSGSWKGRAPHQQMPVF